MNGNQFQYEQVLRFIRYFLDYRIKILSFYLVITGVLLAVTFTYIQNLGGRVAVSAFAIIISIIALLAERRSGRIANDYRDAAIALEVNLGFTRMTEVHEKSMKSVPFRSLFTWLYCVLLVFWLLILLFSVLSEITCIKLL
jgi:hypothetical protein